MKEYRVLVEEIGTNQIDKEKKLSIEQDNNGSSINRVDEERLNDKILYDLTSIDECLTVSMHEYDIERNKKQSFDNRASLIITVLSAIMIAIYDKIPLKSILSLVEASLTFMILMEIITTVLIYMLLVIALYYSIRIISVKTSENFDVTIINGDFAGSAKIDSVSKILEIYLNLTLIHRRKNEVFAKHLSKSQVSMIISIVLIIINLNLL